jgi:hypothetical protein
MKPTTPTLKGHGLRGSRKGKSALAYAYGRKGQLKSWHTEEEEEKKAAKLALQEENEARIAAIVLEKMSQLKEGKKREAGEKGKEA